MEVNNLCVKRTKTGAGLNVLKVKPRSLCYTDLIRRGCLARRGQARQTDVLGTEADGSSYWQFVTLTVSTSD